MSQPDLFTVHEAENNRDSLNNLNENRPHFTQQAHTLLEALLRGEVIDADSAKERYGIRHLARRYADLREAEFGAGKEHLQISEAVIPGSHGMKRIWMSPDQQKANRGIVEKNAQNL